MSVSDCLTSGSDSDVSVFPRVLGSQSSIHKRHMESRRRTASNLSCSFVLSTIETNVKCVCGEERSAGDVQCEESLRLFHIGVIMNSGAANLLLSGSFSNGFSVIVLTLSAETLIFSLHICFHAANAQVLISVQISHL